MLFRPICWLTSFWYSIRYNILTDGHQYVSEYFGYESGFKDMQCEICGKISKGKTNNNYI